MSVFQPGQFMPFTLVLRSSRSVVMSAMSSEAQEKSTTPALEFCFFFLPFFLSKVGPPGRLLARAPVP